MATAPGTGTAPAPTPGTAPAPGAAPGTASATPSVVKDLIEAGVHFGQRKSSWNPRMKPYIFGTRHRIHIIDVRATIRGLLLAKKFIHHIVSQGKDICFVGTKRQARSALEKYAAEVKMPFVTERWLGGTLTNYRTIRERLKRLDELERITSSGEIETYSKKMASQLGRELRKIKRNLEGIRTMTKLPGALVVIDVNREINALREAKNLGIPTICLIDTDGDPDMVDIPIPGNDDSMRSIDVIVRELCEAVRQGKSDRQAAAEGADDPRAGGSDAGQRRRSGRSRFRAEGSPEGAEAGDEGPIAPAAGAPAEAGR